MVPAFLEPDLSLEDLILDAIGRLPDELADIRELEVVCHPSGDPCDLRGALPDVSLVPNMLRTLASALKAGGVDPTLFQPLPGGEHPDEGPYPFALRLSRVSAEERGDPSEIPAPVDDAAEAGPEPEEEPASSQPVLIADALDSALASLVDVPELVDLWSECEPGAASCTLGGEAHTNEDIASWMGALEEASGGLSIYLTEISRLERDDGQVVKEFSLTVQAK